MSKYLFVIDDMGSGGAQRQMSILARSLAEMGHQIDIFHYFPDVFYKDTLDHEGITLILHSKKGKLGFSVIRALAALIKNGKYAVVLSFLATPNLYALLANRLSGRKSKVVVSERTKTVFGGKRYMLKKWVNRNADHLVCNSMHESNNWQTHVPALVGKSTCIYNSVDHNRFIKIKRTKSSTLNILVVGSISPAKNGMVLIEALNELQSTHLKDKIRVTWVGQKIAHIAERKEYSDRMENAIKEYDLSELWKWVDPVKNIENYYNRADVLVHCSTVEGLPNVVCESLSTGLPIIITNVLDHPILADEGNNGFVFQVDDPLSLVNRIEQFYKLSNEERLQLSNNANTFAIEKFSASNFINRYINLFEAL